MAILGLCPQRSVSCRALLRGMSKDEKAFNEYQKLLEDYPTSDRYQNAHRQFEITTRFLNGKRFRIWGLILLYRSMSKPLKCTRDSSNGPFSDVALKAQMNIGQAMENQKNHESRKSTRQPLTNTTRIPRW